MLAIKKICCSHLIAAALFLFILPNLFAQPFTAVLTQSAHTSAQTVSSSLQSGNSALLVSASHHEASLRAVVSKLSLEEKAAQVLMVNIAGSKTADTKSIASFKGTVPGAILLFGYNIADTPQAVSNFLKSAEKN